MSGFKVIPNYLVILGLLLTGATTWAMGDCERYLGVQAQPVLKDWVQSKNPAPIEFVKNQPILGFEITTPTVAGLPPEIRSKLGSVDQTTYSDEAFAKYQGSVIALQMKDDQPDFYPIGMQTYKEKYKIVPPYVVTEKNRKLVDKLQAAGLGNLLAGDERLTGLLKITPTPMYRMSDLGYNISRSVTIQSPWGNQTKPAGQDAFLTWDAGQNMYYMVNTDENGLPIGYILSRPQGVLAADFIKNTVTAMNPPTHKFIKDQPILTWEITSSKFEDIPAVIRNVLGAADQTKYTEEYLAKNIGSAIALQIADKPDFYVIGKATYQEKYQNAPFEDVLAKNPKYVEKLKNAGLADLIDSRSPGLHASLKTAAVEMVKMSQLGLPVEDKIVIESPWGEQTKPEGSDAYLVFDGSQNKYYMVNTGTDGRPLGYVPVPAPAAQHTVIDDKPANQLRVLFGEKPIHISDFWERDRAELNSRVQTGAINFRIRIKDLIANTGGSDDAGRIRPYFVHDLSGFQGPAPAGSVTASKEYLRQIILAADLETKAQNPDALTLFILNGTKEGHGLANEVIDELKSTHQISGVLVAGITSEDNVERHIQALGRGGALIAPNQDAILLTDPSADPQNTVSEDLNLLMPGYRGPKTGVLHIMEGDRRSLGHAVEFLVEAARYNKADFVTKSALELRLHISGDSAALQLSLLLNEFPKLVPDNVKVTLAGKDAAPAGKPSIQTLREAWSQINNVQFRLDAYSRQITGWLNNASHPIYNSDTAVEGAEKTRAENYKMIEAFEKLKTQIDEAGAKLGGKDWKSKT
jgi:hypothetical protein